VLRLLYLLVIVGLAWYGWGLLKRLGRNRGPRPPRRAGAERMVRCEHCQVHLPESTALRHGEHYYCSPEHRDRARG